ncbi:ATP-binding protein [Cyanobium sp. FGCU-52]|nr:ATP-binding protein [Cyanobium sp. FGCU52]
MNQKRRDTTTRAGSVTPTDPPQPYLRCHLLIGPPASGKSTLAAVLAELVGGRVLSTDAIRAELYGDAAIQGSWDEIESLYHQRIHDSVAEGVPVILDATHCQRPWRLAITQALALPAPVQWIGWWLTTPLELCLAWNQTRERQVDEDVIRRLHGFLPLATYKPDAVFLRRLAKETPARQAQKLEQQTRTFFDKQCRYFREEGFAFVEALNPAEIVDLKTHCREVVTRKIDRSIQAACKRRHNLATHRYSRLLDFERLLFLIRLLLEFPGVEFYSTGGDAPQELTDEVAQLRRSFLFRRDAPLPDPDQATFEVRAAFALAHRHGPCYGDVQAVKDDLQWLREQGFTSAFTVAQRIDPGFETAQVREARHTGAGFPQAADRAIFRRQLGLLRYLIQNPFDAPNKDNPVDPALRLDGRKIQKDRTTLRDRRLDTSSDTVTTTKEKRRARRQSSSLRLHLLGKLQQIQGIDYFRVRQSYRRSKIDDVSPPARLGTDTTDELPQISILDKDIEVLITGYGFRNLLSVNLTNAQLTKDHVQT